MQWIYFSPHLDDVVLSCGGLIWQQTQRGDSVEVWTVCAGDLPPGPYTAFIEELHARWESSENTVLMRRAEDRLACARLGAMPRHLPIPDSVYRRSSSLQERISRSTVDLQVAAPGGMLVQQPTGQFAGQPFRESANFGLAEDGPGCMSAESSPEQLAAQRAAYISGFLYPDYHAIFGPVRAEEHTLIDSLAEELRNELPRRARLVCPLSVGGHIDHRFTRAVVERVGRPLWYYADYPYADKKADQVDALAPAGLILKTTRLCEAGMQAWCDSIQAYKSQISTFWASEEAMCAALNAYHDRYYGLRLWHP
jgi:LmbE family N-acetylglucosaminyl deacetylase